MNQTARTSAPLKPRGFRWVWALAVLAAGAGGGAWYHHHAAGLQASVGDSETPSESASEGLAGGDGESVGVKTARLAKGGITRTSTQIGSVHPAEQADLYSKVSGYLETIHVNYGDRVKRDQILAEIDDPEVLADAEKAEADLRQAQAAVAQSEAFVEAAKADRDATASAVEQVAADVARYTSMKAYHGKKFERYKRLVLKEAIPQEIADEQEESYDSAKANELASRKAVLKAKADLAAAAARIKKAEADIDEAKANVGVAEARLDRAKALLGYMKIHSPYDGVVTKRNFFRGAFVRSAAEGGTVPLLTVARTDEVYVVTEIPDRDVPFTDVGDDAEVTLDALPGRVFKAKVSRFAEAEDPTSRTMHTEIDIKNPENVLRAGMYGIAKIFLAQALKASTLPSSCVANESKGGKADVYVIKDGKAKKVRVEIGADDGIRIEIVSGLADDDIIIANPRAVIEGAAVRELKEDSPPAPVSALAPVKTPNDSAQVHQ